MMREFSDRERQLLGIAITLYEKLGKSTLKGLERLNVPTMALRTALGHVESIRTKLGTTGRAIEFTNNLCGTCADAIEIVHEEAEKVKDRAQLLIMPLDQVEEYEYEVRALRRAFGAQTELGGSGAVSELGDAVERQRRKGPAKPFASPDQPGASP